MRPGAPPKPSRYVYTGPGEVSSLITDPPGTRVIPCCNKNMWYIYIYIYRERERSVGREVLRLFRRFTHTHTQLFHTQIFHTQLCHIQSFTYSFLTHTHNFLAHKSFTHNFVTYKLLHTTFSHTHTHNFLTHKSFTHNFVTYNSHTHTQLCHTRHPLFLCVAGVALLVLGWVWWRAWSRIVARGAAALCVAGVALGDIHIPFAWQVWLWVTSTFPLHGRRGTWRHPRCSHTT